MKAKRRKKRSEYSKTRIFIQIIPKLAQTAKLIIAKLVKPPSRTRNNHQMK